MKKKSRRIAPAVLLAALAAAIVWTVWPRSWDDLGGRQQPTSMAGTLAVYTYDVVDQEPSLGADIWTLSAERAEGPAADAIMDALRSGSYRGKLKNLFAYGPFKTSNYSVDKKNSKGYLNLRLVDGVAWDVSVTIYSGGLVVFNDLNNRAGFLAYETDPSVYDALSNLFQEYGLFKEE